jgi:hypothetical protein
LGEQSPFQERRVIRVFVSSTFRDMQDEREELIKRIFPQLRSLCESRGGTATRAGHQVLDQDAVRPMPMSARAACSSAAGAATQHLLTPS